MKDIYQFRNKVALLFSGAIGVLLVSCSGYQTATYDDDGIYNWETPVVVTKDVAVKETSANSKYYEEYFGRTVTDYGEIVEDDVFTDVDSYSSQDVVEQDTENAKESYAAWEDAGDNVTINVYNTRPYYYSYYRPYGYWNNYYYNDWALCNWSWGWGGYYNNYGYYGYNYGYPYYYNSPYYYGYYGRRNYAYINGPRNRRYASNSYYGRNLNRRSTLRSSRATPRRTPRATSPRSTPRSTPRATPRSTPRPRATTPRSTPRPRANTPRPRTVTPRSTPRSTPRATPRPRATSPRSTPRYTPRSTPRSNSRSSSSSRRGRA